MSPEGLMAWQVQTSTTCEVQLFPREHFFVNTVRSLVLGRGVH